MASGIPAEMMAADRPTMKRPRRHATAVAAVGSLLLVAAYNSASLVVLDGKIDGVVGLHVHDERGDLQLRRKLLRTIDDMDSDLMGHLDSDSIRQAALKDGSDEEDAEGGDEESQQGSEKSEPLAPYSLQDALNEASVWDSNFAVIIYDPPSDKFVWYYSESHSWNSGCRKLWNSMNQFVTMLRRTFPKRFRGELSEEFVVAIGSGDYPHVKLKKLPNKGGVAPVLMFGSVFRDPKVYPNMVAMPMPGSHLQCFEEYSSAKRVCGSFRPQLPGALNRGLGYHARGDLVGDENDMQWEDLIPQVIWRGTDFGYLPTLTRPKYNKPLDNKIEELVKTNKLRWKKDLKKKKVTTKVLRENYEGLLPRWKGAVLSAEADLEVAKGLRTLPWADIKFSRSMHDGYFPATQGSRAYKEYDELGIATGEYMHRDELAKYRYQIDLAGGGGTTWTGTTEKLAMPGLLFHHVTPTKDYIHDRMEPWRHYVPVAPDLRDLKEKFEWAEVHPEQAKRIADRATALMRHLGTPEGFGEMFQEAFAEPMRRVLEAYQPVSSTHPGRTYKDLLEELPEGSRMVPVIECHGMMSYVGACRAADTGESVYDADTLRRLREAVPIYVESHLN